MSSEESKRLVKECEAMLCQGNLECEGRQAMAVVFKVVKNSYYDTKYGPA